MDKLKTYAVTLLLIIGFSLAGQNSDRIIDSLEKKLKVVKEDTMRVISLNNLSKIYLERGIYDKSISLSEAAVNLSQKLSYKKGLAVACNNLGIVYDYRGDYIKSIDYHNKSLTIRKEFNDIDGIAASYGNLAIVYEYLGKLPEALKFQFDALKLHEKIGDENGTAITYINMGSVYVQQLKYAEAMNCFQKSLAIFNKLNDKGGIGYAESGIGMVKMYEKKMVEAEEHVLKSKIIFEELGDKQNVAAALGNLGQIYVATKRLKEAEGYYRISLRLGKEMDDKRNISYGYLGLSNIATQLKNYAHSKALIDSAIMLSQQIGCIECLRDSYSAYTTLDSSSANFKGAYDHTKLFILYRDSLMSQDNNRKSSQAKLQYDFDKKAIADSLKNREVIEKEELRHEQEIQQQKLYSYGAAFGFILMLITAGISYRAFKQKQRTNVIIENQKAIVEEKQKEILDSINYAERIQHSFLASSQILDKHLREYFVFFQPKAVVSGDFYWAGTLANGQFALMTADSTGHGVPGAIMSIVNISALEKSIELGACHPSEILNNTRRFIVDRLKNDGSAEGGKDGMDCSLISFDAGNSKITYAAANNPIWVVRDNQLIELAPDKMPVGKHDKDQNSFTQREFMLQKNDLIYTLTDGMADQFGGPKGKKYMYKKLKELLISVSTLPVNEQHQKIEDAMNDWKGNLEQVDDVTLIGIKI
ncbi:MAG: tetratricopeptide repeat protein [Bacteroidota bacterium]